jgi:hypothetical protein
MFADGIMSIFSYAVHASDRSEKARKRLCTIAGRRLSGLLARRWKDRDAAHTAAELKRMFGALHVPAAAQPSLAQQPCGECNQALCPAPQDRRRQEEVERCTCD